MNIRDLALRPRRRRGKNLPMRREEAANPFFALQREVNRLFEDFFAMTPQEREDWMMEYPQVDVRETDKDLKVSAELPGLTDKDIEVLISGDSLTIKGEKKEEKEDRKENYHRMERRYGSFRRVVQLPGEVKADIAQAVFKNGVLEITIPKTEEAKKEKKKVEIKT
ncbi:MAG: Hsp20/alpha crystallin family protein [Syntrophaceae bacterium]